MSKQIDAVGTPWGILVMCKSRATARRHYPHAQAIARVDGGFLVFDYHHDYVAWKKQK